MTDTGKSHQTPPEGGTAYSPWSYIRAGIYFNLYGLVKYLPSPLGDLFRAGVLKIFSGRIQSIWIKDGVTVWFPEGLRVGRKVSINENVFISAFGGVEIGDNCRIAHQCSIVSENHGFDRVDVPIRQQPKQAGRVVLEGDVWLGAGVRVMAGVRIGRGSVVGAGAVVTQDLPSLSVAAGVPARVLRKRGTRQPRNTTDRKDFQPTNEK